MIVTMVIALIVAGALNGETVMVEMAGSGSE